MVKVLNSDALVPTADTIKRDVMNSFEEERSKRKILFQVNACICKIIPNFLKTYIICKKL
jgi:hypothetical protein